MDRTWSGTKASAARLRKKTNDPKSMQAVLTNRQWDIEEIICTNRSEERLRKPQLLLVMLGGCVLQDYRHGRSVRVLANLSRRRYRLSILATNNAVALPSVHRALMLLEPMGIFSPIRRPRLTHNSLVASDHWAGRAFLGGLVIMSTSTWEMHLKGRESS